MLSPARATATATTSCRVCNTKVGKSKEGRRAISAGENVRAGGMTGLLSLDCVAFDVDTMLLPGAIEGGGVWRRWGVCTCLPGISSQLYMALYEAVSFRASGVRRNERVSSKARLLGVAQ